MIAERCRYCNAKPAKQNSQFTVIQIITKPSVTALIADKRMNLLKGAITMTEIRIYEDHNKVVIAREVSAPTDKLFEAIDYEEAIESWRDDEWEYIRYPLDKFMANVKRLL